LLAQLSDDYNTTLADVDAKTKNVETLTAENTKLLKSNNDLFQLVGSNMNVFKQSDNHQTTNQEEDKKPTFDALFDDKGNLK
jgi:regulator of replication initiation timing